MWSEGSLGVPMQRAEGRSRRIVRSERCADALDAAALLVDEDGRIVAPHRGAEFAHQIADLARLADVAREEDEAPRPLATEEAAFLVRQPLAGAAENDRL